MNVSLSTLQQGGEPRPSIITLYGTSGCGKTTMAAGAPSPVFLMAEDGLGQLKMPNWSIRSFDDLMQALEVLYVEKHDFRTVVLDSLDWVEPLIWAETCARYKWSNIEAVGYGKGYIAASDVWREYLEAVSYLRSDRDMTIIQIAHDEVRRFDSPTTEPYDRYGLRLQGRASALIREASDVVGFLTWKVTVARTKVGFDKSVARGVGSGLRALHVEERPGWIAKGRYGMPPSIDIPSVKDAASNPGQIWAMLAEHLPQVGP